ncbi:hypothetical protein BDQ12DRAFT_769180 [Crucibulum laeve]|uniref:Uncharacterized protein n=1 Tax=Crucibulum laeve TaxID=68775 RepID=A0A5C3LKC1_9AGAR|nr:hypothetical protein BDQ12DRAFT_769180 [Crucibulum laeve]
MPAPAVYVLAVVGAVGAAFAFKEFVYEPHIAPRVERWAAEFVAKREAQRRQREGPIAVPLRSRRRRNRRSSSNNTSTTDDDDHGIKGTGPEDAVELDHLVAREVREWRSEVDRSTTLRHRRAATLDESINPIPYIPMSPTHVIFDPSLPSTPSETSTLPSRVSTPPPQVSPMRPNTTSSATLEVQQSTPIGSPTVSRTPQVQPQQVPPPVGYVPAPYVPSLSQVYPQELDAEHGIELLSPPSSRSVSPFSNLSAASLSSPPPTFHSLAPAPTNQNQHDNETASDSNYISFPSTASSPVQIERSLSAFSSPSPVTFASLAEYAPSPAHEDPLPLPVSPPVARTASPTSSSSSPFRSPRVQLPPPARSDTFSDGAMTPRSASPISASSPHSPRSPEFIFTEPPSPRSGSGEDNSDLDFLSDFESESGRSDSSWVA